MNAILPEKKIQENETLLSYSKMSLENKTLGLI
jgi:hypothetical protein